MSASTDNVKTNIKCKIFLLLNKELRRKYILNFGVISCIDSFTSRPIYPGEGFSWAPICY
jgi:hypothetical protein